MNRPTISGLDVTAHRIPTDAPEADGTLAWNATTIVIVKLKADDRTGIGYSYTHAAAARVIADTLAPIVEGGDALAPAAAWEAMNRGVRNEGRAGITGSAIAAVDVALWDLKARLLDLPLTRLLGARCDSVPAYGSGGFTSYSIERLQRQLAGWVEAGIMRVKMKVGSRPAEDPARVHAARQAIGPDAELFVDANGAYARKQALALAHRVAEDGVSWLEEPVSSDDLAGLRLIRDRAPAAMEVAAGEYGFDVYDFRRLLEARAIDVMQPDATRCGGVTGFLQAAELCRAHGVPLSAHTAPSLHAHLCCAVPNARHAEYFHDHARIEAMLFDGALEPRQGCLVPDDSRPGLGLEWRSDAAARYRV
ncbi:MAG TPA: enolase C-terminal domain-like protein [Woeseiaceae bacterium]|nr:enolase C-terminal domain-like protein [Woeseiaceae bacterium]